MRKCVPLSEIKSNPIVRDTTGFEELDFIYGYSSFPECTLWGFPEGKISLWAAESGTGKSRLAIDVCKRMSKLYSNSKILYFQTEAELQDFADWVPDSSNYRNIFCSGENRIKDITSIILEIRPKIAFVDSVNEIEEFASGSKKEARLLINGRYEIVGLRKVCQEVGCHLVLLGQLNQDGTIKGGTSLPHLVDIALDMKKCYIENKKGFDVKVGIKHRYGRSDKDICGKWCHTDLGVQNVSINRKYDEKWCNLHGYAPLPPIVVPETVVKPVSGVKEKKFSSRIDSLLTKAGMSREEYIEITSSKEKMDKWTQNNLREAQEFLKKSKGSLLRRILTAKV